jgi:hypothetical protein
MGTAWRTNKQMVLPFKLNKPVFLLEELQHVIGLSFLKQHNVLKLGFPIHLYKQTVFYIAQSFSGC